MWLGSFLERKTQYVKWIRSDFGVPQGSHCRPILFNVFENDLNTITNFYFVLYYYLHRLLVVITIN